MLAAFAEALMSAQASMQCNAAYGERTDERENSRNGYRMRPWDTRGRLGRPGCPEAPPGRLFHRSSCCSPAPGREGLVAVVCQAYVEGVSTRRVDDLVRAMGIEGISKSEVSRMAKSSTMWWPSSGTALGRRPIAISGSTRDQRVREGGRVVNVTAVIATPSTPKGTGSSSASTSSRRRTLPPGRPSCARWWPGGSRGWSWSSPMPTEASRQPSPSAGRGHLAAVSNPLHGQLASRVAKGNWPMIAALVRSIFEQPIGRPPGPAGRRG